MGDHETNGNFHSSVSALSSASQISRKKSDSAVVPTPSSISTGSPSPATIVRKRASVTTHPKKLSTSFGVITEQITGNDVLTQRSIPTSQDSPLSPPSTRPDETSPEGRRTSITVPRRRSSSLRRSKKSNGLLAPSVNGPLLESPSAQEYESSNTESPKQLPRSSSLQKDPRKNSVNSSAPRRASTKRSMSVTLPVLRKNSQESMQPEVEKRSAASSAGVPAGTQILPPNGTETLDFTKLLRLIDPSNPLDGLSGEVLRMCSHLSREDLEESTKQLPETRRQEILNLIAEIQHWNQVKDEVDSAQQNRNYYLPPIQPDPDLRTSRVSSHPYNVIFESDDASMSNDGKKPKRDGAGRNTATPVGVSDIMDREASNNLEKILDDWYRGLRQALLTENAAVHERIILGFNRSMQDAVKSQQQESDRLHSDIDSLYTLCRSYSKAIFQRDRTIANLSEALASQKEQTALAQRFNVMKMEAADDRREAVREKLAKSFYEKNLAQKVWFGWRSVHKEGWKQKIEKACQSRAEEVCHKMADQYDARIAELEEIIRKLREENKRFREERDRVNSKAREALLHGVSVLKAEAEQFPAERIRSEEGENSTMGSRKESKEAASGSDASDRTVQSRSGQESNEEAAAPARSRNPSQTKSQGSSSSSQNSRKVSSSSNRPSSKNDSP